MSIKRVIYIKECLFQGATILEAVLMASKATLYLGLYDGGCFFFKDMSILACVYYKESLY